MRRRRGLAVLLIAAAVAVCYVLLEFSDSNVISKCLDCDLREKIEMPIHGYDEHSIQDRLSSPSRITLINPDEAQEKGVHSMNSPATANSDDFEQWEIETTPTTTKRLSTPPTVTDVVTFPNVKPKEDIVTHSNLSICSTTLLKDDGFVRNCITNEVVGRLPRNLRTALFRDITGFSPETSDDRKQSFQKVFDTRAWGHSWDVQYKGLNASGMGATVHWTQEAMAALHIIINQLKQYYNVSRIRLLDIPCGDMAWMSRFLKTRDDIDYTGVDIVPDLIKHHRETFKGYPWKFELRDVVSSSMNDSFHLVLSRTLLQHLYERDIFRLLGHISGSGSGFLLLTSFFRHGENKDLVIDSENPGRFRKINLELKPFSLVPPLCMFRDGPPDAYEGWDHFLALWKLPLRRVRRCRAPTEFGLRGTKLTLFSCTDWSLTSN